MRPYIYLSDKSLVRMYVPYIYCLIIIRYHSIYKSCFMFSANAILSSNIYVMYTSVQDKDISNVSISMYSVGMTS